MSESGTVAVISLTDEQAGRLADAVARRRRELGLTQREAAEAGGLGYTTLRHIEYARRTAMRADTAASLCRALRWSRADLLAAAGAADPEGGPLLRLDGPGESITCRVLNASDDAVDRVERAAHAWERWSVTWVNPPGPAGEVVVKAAADDPDRAQLLEAVRRLPADAVPRALGFLLGFAEGRGTSQGG